MLVRVFTLSFFGFAADINHVGFAMVEARIFEFSIMFLMF
jgi:hypothetical protein